MNFTDEARMIYEAQPTAYNARALQMAVHLDKRANPTRKWEPEETAPRSRWILVIDDRGEVDIGMKWDTGEWNVKWEERGLPPEWKPLYWMELPEPPK